MKDMKLTSVKVVPTLYSSFKQECIESQFTLQKLVNRSLDLYENNEEFRKMIQEHHTLQEQHKTKKL